MQIQISPSCPKARWYCHVPWYLILPPLVSLTLAVESRTQKMAFLVREVLLQGQEDYDTRKAKGITDEAKVTPISRFYLHPGLVAPGDIWHCTPAPSAVRTELTMEEEHGLRHRGRSHFPRPSFLNLSAPPPPRIMELQITPWDSISSETTPNIKMGGRACVGSNAGTETGHSVTNILSSSLSESASLVSSIPRLSPAHCSSPCQAAVGGHCCLACAWLCSFRKSTCNLSIPDEVS